MASKRAISEDLVRDLVECVQAARDGADSNSLFAIQCDLVLTRAHAEVDGIVQRRSHTRRRPSDYRGRQAAGAHMTSK